MANSLQLTWDLIARDGASPVFDRVSKAADKAAASTEAATEKTAASFSTLAKVGAVAGVAFAAAAVKMASDFQKQMLLVQTQAGASAQEVKNMTPAILALSGKVAQAPEALATSLYHVESTGLRGKAALDAVKVAAEGAAVGHADLEETTNALTATIASGMVPATESFSQAMGQLNTIVGSGDMKLSDLNEALGTGVLVQVKQYGATLNDVGAALADFGDNNIRGADAATMVRMAVQAIAKPGVDAASALGRIGLTVQQLQSDEQTGGLNKALTDLHTHFVNSGIDASQWGAIMTDAFTKKAGGGLITLIGTYDRFEQKYKEVSAGAASFADEWAATQKTAAFQAAALKDNIDAMTISVGDHLLPVVTTTLGWINSNGVPALQHLGSGAMDVAHWFGELPGPIRDTALALGALGLSNAIGLTGAFATGVQRLGSVFSGTGGVVKSFGDEMELQQALAAMDARSVGELDAAFGALSGSAARAAGSLSAAQVSMTSGQFAGWDLALSQVAVEEETVVSGAGRMSSALATAGVQGKRGLQGLYAMLGGGAGLGLAGAVVGVTVVLPELIKGFDLLTGNVIDSTAATQSFTQALDQTNGVIDTSIDKIAQQQLEQAGVVDIFQKAGISAKDAIAGIEGNADAQHRVNTELQHYIDKQNFLGQQGGISHAADLLKTKDAYNQLAAAFHGATQDAKYFGDASHTAAGYADAIGQAAKNAAPGLEYAASSAGMSADQIKTANKEWEAWIKNLSGLAGAFADPLTTYEDLLSQKQQAEQASAQATAAATKSGKDSWKDYTQNVSVSLSEYAKQLEGQLKNEADWQKNLVTIAQRGGFEVAQQFADMGQKGADLTAQMANATDANFNRMATDMAKQATVGGSQAAANLDTQMRVMAEIGKEGGSATAQAVATALGVGINDVASIAQQYGVTLATGLEPILQGLGKPPIIVPGYVTRPGLIGRNADGGYITGDGNGRSDSILSWLSNGEFVMNAATTAIHRPLLEALNNAPGYANGGFASPSDVPHPYSTGRYGPLVAAPSNGTMQVEYADVTSWLQANSNNPYVGAIAGATSQAAVQLGARMAAAAGWTGVAWTDLVKLWTRESGWNPYAVNPSSGAYGIPQSLGHGHPYNLGDSAAQIAWGINYIKGRYGDPINAWAHEMAAGWYHNGGVVPGGRGTNVPAVLEGGETVRTARQEAALFRPQVVILQLDGGAVTDLLEGRAVQVVADYNAAVMNRSAY